MSELLINIDVSDLERAVAFYTQAFELRVGRRLGRFAVELSGAQASLFLLAKEAGSAAFVGATELRRYERHWTPVHLDWVVRELERSAERVEALGARRESDMLEYSWGRLALFSDPFGHGFCLVQFRGKGYDELVTA